jgi:uncharacterized pyridoxamine 5'-phosphate oxidase family protein
MKIDRNDILQVMDQADAVYLATVNGSAPRIRAMVKPTSRCRVNPRA